MSTIMAEHYGAREIQPASMWPGLTRPGLGIPAWQAALRRAEGGFVLSAAGTWLPNQEASAEDLELATRMASFQNPNNGSLPREHRQLSTILGNVAVTTSGCWQGDIASEDYPSALVDLTRLDSGHDILEKAQYFPSLRQCDTPGCLYPRHYDLTLNVPSQRRALLYPDLRFYMHTEQGIITAWGDRLPAVDESRERLRNFQQQCVPYVTRKESLLTLGGAAQISLVPQTGCWFVRSYYMTPLGVDGYENWQYDGYGRLKIPTSVAETYGYATYATLAHRVVWMLTGHSTQKRRSLNHKCGFRPCANPDHLVQVSYRTNIRHGEMMATAAAMMDERVTITAGLARLRGRARTQNIKPQDTKEFWEAVELACPA